MKNVGFFLAIYIIIGSCKKQSNEPNIDFSILQKQWNFGYKIKNKNADGSYGKWTTINTFAPVLPITFLQNGNYLINKKTPSECCQFTKYRLSGKTIIYSDLVNSEKCATIKCATCATNTIININADSLELESCGIINLWLAGN